LKTDELTVLDYYATHAPAVQDWFEPRMPEKPASSPFQTLREFEAGAAEWEAEYYKQRLVQWPLAWAREQCVLREIVMHKKPGAE